MDLIPNLLPIMSFGAILLLYAIFINFLIAKKRESNNNDNRHVGYLDSELNLEFNFDDGIDKNRRTNISTTSQSLDQQLMSFINELKKQENIAGGKSGVKRKIIISLDKKLTDLNWFNKN